MTRRPAKNERTAIVGERMKLAAEQAGYRTTVAMGEAMGMPNSTISRWWNGQQTPETAEMEHYAQVVGKKLWWFYMDTSDSEFELVADALQEIVRLAVAGRDLADAYSQVTGETDRFSRSERASLNSGTRPLRSRIQRESGGDPGQVPAVVDRLAAEALGE